MQACWDAAGEVIKAWATEGHSVALPGLGTMRFGLRAKSVATVDEVKSKLITSRKIVFTPSTDLKDELANTAIQITCYDKDGNVLKRVTSTDEGIVEDPEGDETGEGDGKTGDNENENENQNGGSTNPEPGTVNPEPGTGGGGTGDGTDES
jgi:nucleoid DNA-binding protein